ncbi:DNA ligase [Thiorhodovibrio frisius]|uniref:ATP dependent DNA ligase-like protein n=1 Tax=Thiorhodovibrio frisius TaxID=631362 RepID=H8YZ92_9GAMM|nr:DNA ligase [Thiorhodovibrio frisius]EIC22019.1 ATP dependent DNA ligase-like protein [Thiorhodovibrio frisius]WPL24310.1 DNA ligase [Thiorhodovibrio frisius]
MPSVVLAPGRTRLRLSIFFLLILVAPAPLWSDARNNQPDTGISEAAATAHPHPPTPPALMLAKTHQAGTDVAHYWVSEKLDGVRARWDGSRLISRGGHVIQAPDWFVAGFPSVPLDGELWLGRGQFALMSGLARRQEPDEDAWREVRFMVFDLPTLDAPFSERLVELQRLLADAPSERIALIEQFRVADEKALLAHLAAVERLGGEGLMLHHEDARYREGRSSDLLKVKSKQDAEAKVLAHLPGRGKYQGMLGALLVQDDQGRRFRIGTGFSDAERRNPPPIGSTITFQYQGETKTGLPRFASYLRLREAE